MTGRVVSEKERELTMTESLLTSTAKLEEGEWTGMERILLKNGGAIERRRNVSCSRSSESTRSTMLKEREG